ncbi:Marginal zone B [Mactra antiquata]
MTRWDDKLMHFFALIGLFCFVSSEVTQNEDGSSGTISFSPPSLNDEEAHSLHMPSNMKCDACTAVVYQLSQGFEAFHKKRKSVKTIPESDLFDIIDEVCEGKVLENYGVKEVRKVKRLSGPGLEAADEPGIMAGGGRWPARMKSMCSSYLEEFDENRIYKEYMKKDDSLHSLLCKSNVHPGLTDVCSTFSEKKDEL